MRCFARIIDRGPRRIALLGAVVLLPAVALGLLALRAFRGEQVREEYQRKERQQQILRLLEIDLVNWIRSRRGEPAGNTFVFEVRESGIFLPRLNVYLSPDHQRESGSRVPGRDASFWYDAHSFELRGGSNAAAVRRYRTLATANPAFSSWSRLALLRLALQRTGSPEVAFRLSEIREKDLGAATESGIPIWVAAALLLLEHMGHGLPQEAAGFPADTLSHLEGGRWHLNAAQWTYYAREICPAVSSTPALRSRILATADRLESFAGSLQEVLVLNQSLEWRRGQSFAAQHLQATELVVVLFPGGDRNTGCVLSSVELLREAETRLTSLTAAEDFQGRITLSPGSRAPTAVTLTALPCIEVSFSERDQTLWLSYLRKYSLFGAVGLLMLVAGVGLSFTYRAVAREMEANRMKAEFVSSISHEFRTPLSAIEALLERLESGKVRDDEMLRRYYQASRREVQRLTAMVNQLLDFSRIKEGRQEFSFETIDLNLLAEEAVLSFRDLGFGARLVDSLAREKPLTISADRDAVYQCIHNLIDNALKYSPDESQVEIASGQWEGGVFLRVSDRGSGIPPEEQELVFEQFYRAKSAEVLRVRGAGIGLALVRRVMQAHGGAVALESRPGEGSSFQIRFPEGES